MEIIIRSICDKELFTHNCENNTIKKTLLEAIKVDTHLIYANLEGANLRDANLEGANLEYADLRNADLINANLANAGLINADLRNANLIYANLIYANLINANLINANLRDANLIYANLRDANLRDANLRDANLEGANLEGAKNIKESFLPIYCKWSLSIHGDDIKIGCKEKSIENWDKWFSGTDVFDTERSTEEFKRIEASYKAFRAYMLHMDNVTIKKDG